MIYLFIVIVLLLCISTYDVYGNMRYKYTSFYLIVFLFIFLNIFSYKIGGDMGVYTYRWNNVYRSIFAINYLDEIDLRSQERPGWILLTSFLKGICDNFIILKIFLAFWVNLIVAHFIKSNTKFIFSALLIYFIVSYFNYNFEILRESIAVSFFLLSFPFYVNRKWIKYFICFLFAFMFHESSLVMLIMPFFSLFERINNRALLLLMILLYVLFLSFDIISFLLNILPNDFAFYAKVVGYMNSEVYGENVSVNMYYFFVASFVMPFLSFLVLMNNKEKKCISVFILISIVFSLFTSKIVIFYRFNNYIILPLIVAYIEVIYLVSKKIIICKSKKIFFIPILLLYLSYKVFNIYLKEEKIANGKFYNRYYPYNSIFEEKISKDRSSFLDQIARHQGV
ncbi:EpsG family protein [Parabacteroides goldsteinii]|uniref:EpsG family protein n=1 Tax=Parabacteroides goldsteinii TaxID=328812 RepID=UPI00189BA0E0|nr:EpsG family protein [Parabacteroides goldsteinii]